MWIMSDDGLPPVRFGRRTFVAVGGAAAILASIGVAWPDAARAMGFGTVQDFYDPSHWGSRFGVIDADHPTPHRGLDIVTPGESNTPVPILRSGTIASVGSSPVIGNYFVVQVAPGDFDGYAHQISITRSAGQAVSQGDFISQTAKSGDFHGTAWSGCHLHLTNSPTVGGIISGTVRDPAPIVLGVINGGGSTPTHAGEQDMLMIYVATPTPTFAVFGPNFWWEFPGSDLASANSLMAQIAGSTSIGATTVTPAYWSAIKAATGH